MFDYIRCERTLPDGSDNTRGFQTKSLDRNMDKFVINECGWLTTDDGNDDVVDFSGEMVFYGEGPQQVWKDYTAKFSAGRLIAIRPYPKPIPDEDEDG